jgi:hypothetical protein
MPNKKTVKRNRRNSKRSRSRKGGIFGLFEDKHNEGVTDEKGNLCGDSNNLVNLTDRDHMRINYQTCCPKTWYGRKNNSPYCKQLDLNYKAAFQESKMETASTKQMIKTNTFNVNDDNIISVIDCKNPDLYNTEEEMENYIKTCECNKTRYNPFSEKKANCAIIKPKLAKLQAQERPTEVFNPIQQNNQYMPVGQNDNQNYNDNDNEAEAQERPTEVSNPYQNIQPQEQPEDQNQRPSLYSPEGGKRRKTKKHFKKRSIRKRSIKKRKGRKH